MNNLEVPILLFVTVLAVLGMGVAIYKAWRKGTLNQDEATDAIVEEEAIGAIGVGGRNNALTGAAVSNRVADPKEDK